MGYKWKKNGKADNAFDTKAECAKLIGNSAYGSTILYNDKMKSNKICNETDLKKYIYNSVKQDFQKLGNIIELLFNPKCITEMC